MVRGALSWRRLCLIALAVLAVHALLLRNLHDAVSARAGSAPMRSAAALQVRTLMHAAAGRTEAALEAVTPTAGELPPAQGTDRAAPEPARQPPTPSIVRAAMALAPSPSTPRDVAPRPAAPRDVPTQAAAALVPPLAPMPEALLSSPGAVIAGAPAAPAAGTLPIYRTLLPPAFAFAYELRRGATSGSSELSWQPQGEHYRARFAATSNGAPLLAWDSTGGFDDAGIAPTRYTDRRRDRGTQAANFRREQGKITFSGPALEHPLPPGAQDRLSWMLQLAAIAAAEPALVGPGGRVSFLVVGARGDADVWTFFHRGVEILSLAEGGTATVRLLREPGRAYDTRAEVWLDPARHYLPVRARLSNASGNDALLFELREVLAQP